jgi:hypothetical protein
MINVIFDQEKTDADDLKRLMDYGIQYVLIMDQLMDDKDDPLYEDDKDDPLYEDDYFNDIRPAVLRTIKNISQRGIELQKENKNGGLFNINLLDFNYFLLAVKHHLESNLNMYDAKGKFLLGVNTDQVKKDLEIVNKKLKLIDDGNEALNEKDKS